MKPCEGAFRTVAIALLVSVIGVLLAFRFVSGNVLVKGNGSSMIYHTRQCASYAATIIGNDVGDRYFLSETAAHDAGYRKAKNCYH
jgi:hypothetical protein